MYISHLVTRRRTAIGLPPLEAAHGAAAGPSAATAAAGGADRSSRRGSAAEPQHDLLLPSLRLPQRPRTSSDSPTSPFASEAAQAAGQLTGSSSGPSGGEPTRAVAAGPTSAPLPVGTLQQQQHAQLLARLRLARHSEVDAEASDDDEDDLLPPPPAAAALATALATDPHTLSACLLRGAGDGSSSAVAAGAGQTSSSAPAGGHACSSLLRGGMLWLPGEAPVPLNVNFKAEIEPVLGRVLGRGGYGVVYEAFWQGQKVGLRMDLVLLSPASFAHRPTAHPPGRHEPTQTTHREFKPTGGGQVAVRRHR